MCPVLGYPMLPPLLSPFRRSQQLALALGNAAVTARAQANSLARPMAGERATLLAASGPASSGGCATHGSMTSTSPPNSCRTSLTARGSTSPLTGLHGILTGPLPQLVHTWCALEQVAVVRCE